MAVGSTTLERERPAARRLSGTLSAVVRWAFLLGLAAIIVVPIGYAAISGFRDNFQITSAPIALPDPWIVSNYTDVLTDPGFWQQLGNSLLIAVITTVVVVTFAALAAFVFARGAFRGREVLFTLFTLGLLFPAAVAILPLFVLVRDARAARQPAGHRPAPGGVRPAPDDHHPAAVLPEHPERARGRRADRRLQHVRVLLADPPAAVRAGPGHGRRARHRVQLERVPAAARHPVGPEPTGRCPWA